MENNINVLIQKANNGDVDAMFSLAEAYTTGTGVEQSDELSHKYFQMAADKGNIHSIFMVGMDYFYAVGTPQNKELGISYIKHAADNGYSNAQYIMGLLYMNKELKALNRKGKAAKYFEAAAKQGHSEAQVSLGDLYFLGDGVAEDLNESIFWLSCAYMQGSEDATKRLNDMIHLGLPGGTNRIQKVCQNIQENYLQYVPKIHK